RAGLPTLGAMRTMGGMGRPGRPWLSRARGTLVGALGLALLAVATLPTAGCRLSSAPARQTAPDWLAGAGVRKITPDLGDPGRPVYVGGLERGLKASGIHDDLFARALVLTDVGGASVGLVVLDLIGFFHDDVEAIRGQLKAAHPEVRLAHLAVASTHTHAGPDVIGLWTPIGGSVDDAYMSFVRAEAVEAIAGAWRSRRPAVMTVGVSTAPGLAVDTRLPEVIDESVLAMGLKDASSGQGIASLVNWNSHPSVSGGENSLISADFPWAVVARMEREWGGTALYASGALGGQIGSGRVKIQDPQTGEKPKDRMKRAALIGDRVARIALDALASSASGGSGAAATGRVEAEPAIRVKSETLYVPMDNPRFARGLSIGLLRPRRLYPLDGDGPGRLPSELSDPSSLKAGQYSLRTEVAAIDLGEAVWALIPGELYPELALGRVQRPQDPGSDFQGAPAEPALRAMSDKPVFLIGLANDELGYLVPMSQWDEAPPFAYGRDEPQYGERNSVGPRTAAMVMRAFDVVFAGFQGTE
ncbi:MAG TPA: hypothetical protein VFP98_03175, partial [Candidatus Polarisedimenticolia bacterium]|nr:hypothetical protein [Candidatus Polarisedimenticolia bacterium]